MEKFYFEEIPIQGDEEDGIHLNDASSVQLKTCSISGQYSPEARGGSTLTMVKKICKSKRSFVNNILLVEQEIVLYWRS